jgi:hypothetical protein
MLGIGGLPLLKSWDECWLFAINVVGTLGSRFVKRLVFKLPSQLKTSELTREKSERYNLQMLIAH